MNVLTRARGGAVAEQNDVFRHHMLDRVRVWNGQLLHGRVVCTPRISALRSDHLEEVLRRVVGFEGFDAANDPYGEHDLGAVEVADGERPVRVLWRIDCYDRGYEWGSPDPADPRETRRVLTIMLASDY